MEPEEFKLAIKQWREALKTPSIVACPCGRKLPLTFLYKCLYCGIWYCKECAEKHFGKTRKQWQEEKAIEKQ